MTTNIEEPNKTSNTLQNLLQTHLTNHKQNPTSNVKVQFSIIYHSTTAQMIQDAVADLHCRSDHYLAEEIYREYTDAS